jgi:hypothetical protein
MPNWCENRLTLTHKNSKKLEKIRKAMEEGNFFNTIIPTPKALLNEKLSSYSDPANNELRAKAKAKHGFESWYDFRKSKWGTKWEVEIDEPEIVGNEIEVSFLSAWSPPIGIYEKLTEMGFHVDASFVEFGMVFAGTYTSEEGLSEYDFNNLPSDLDEEFGITESLKDWEQEEAE